MGDIHLNKVAKVTFAFWIIKIAATTLGETGGDALSMSMNLGYAISSVIFFGFFLISVVAQVRAKAFHRFLYWSVIVTTTTVGTTMADYADRSMGIGYVGGSLMLFILLIMVIATWKFTLGSVSVNNITSPKTEIFYWVTILFSNTLGTALGDFIADSSGLGYERGALVFFVALLLIALAYFWTTLSRTLLFWMAFILTRPLGATLGDLLTKPLEHGGLDLSRIGSSIVLMSFMTLCILCTTQERDYASSR
ncbi:MAG TPA: hypothetical protein VGV92_02420 [Gammaproteobacteria bacterium]|nr:hypothetical protein [Gammaproteobacteria bacterium]